MTTEIIAMIANLSLALSFIIALIFGIGQVRAAERDRKDRFTLETLRNFQTREFSELMNYITIYDGRLPMKIGKRFRLTKEPILLNLPNKWNL